MFRSVTQHLHVFSLDENFVHKQIIEQFIIDKRVHLAMHCEKFYTSITIFEELLEHKVYTAGVRARTDKGHGGAERRERSFQETGQHVSTMWLVRFSKIFKASGMAGGRDARQQMGPSALFVSTTHVPTPIFPDDKSMRRENRRTTKFF